MSDPTIVLSAQDNASRVIAAVRGQIASMSDATEKLRGALGAIGVGLSVGAFTAFIRNTVSGIDALNDLKDATGASIENISALEDVAARTGTSFEAMGTSLVKFNAALSNAQPGSAAARAFEALGLSVSNLKGLDPAEALRQTAVALSRFADDGNKARLVQELFGKALREVAPFLNDLASQSELVAKVTAQQAAEAEKFNQQLAALAKNSQDAGRALIGDLVVGINAAAKAYRESGLFEAVRTLFTGDEQHRSNVQLVQLTDRMLAAERALGEARKAGLAEDSVVVQRRKEALSVLQAEIAALQRRRSIDDPNNQSAAETARLGRRKSLPDVTTGPAKPERSKGIEAVTTELDRYLESLQKQLEKEQELTELQKAQIRISEASAQGFSEAQRQAILDLAGRIDKERELKKEREDNLKLAEALDAALVAGDQAFAKRLQTLRDATPTAELERARKDQELLAQAFKEGTISEQEYLEAAAARAGITAQNLEKTKSLAEELGLTFSSAFEDAIAGGKGLSSVLKGLQQDLLRIVVRKTVTEPLGKWFSGKISDIFGGFFADGGSPPLGKISMVGERGPELFVPRERGTIIPNGAGLGGNVTVVINQTVGDVATVSLLQESNRNLARTIQAQILRSVNRGGALA